MATRDELLALLVELIRRPSCWDNAEDQRKLGEYIRDWFEQHRIKATVDDLGNVVVNPDALIVMNGHIDVVPAAGEADYIPKVKGDNLVGRGASDMKGGIAVAMHVMKELYAKYNEVGAVFQITEESEYAKSGVDILCERGVFDKAKFIIEAEPSVELTTGKPIVYVGSEGGYDWSTKLNTDDSPYHAAYLHLANNAILAATQYIEGLLNDRSLTMHPDEFKRTYNPRRIREGKGPINVARIEAGTQPTWTPNHCVMEFEKRLYPSERWTSFEEQLREYSRGMERSTRVSIEIDPLWHADPFVLDDKSDGYKFVENWTKKERLESSISNGATDLNKIHNYLKAKGSTVSGIHFGPGFLDVAHRSDEFTSIKDLERFYGLYLHLIKELIEGEGRSLLQ